MKWNSPNYGLDAPGVVRGFLLGGPALAVAGFLLARYARPIQNHPLTALGDTML